MDDEYRQTITLKSLKTLRAYMRHRKLTTAYAIAKAADLRTQSGRIADGRVQHLVSGRRRTCELETALAITDALDVPMEALFDVREYRVSGDKVAA